MRSVIVAAELESLPAVTGLVADVAREAGLGSDATYRLRLAAEELLTNIIRHGYADHPGQPTIQVHAEVLPDRVRLRLSDSAAPFDPVAAPPPAGLDLPLQHRVAGALGLYLAKDAVDEITHEYAGGNHTTVEVLRNHEGRPGDG
jgi:anti-sigma regulatory factor (Ser/Thr protein kinase)